jgi:hypothetical protein
MYEKVPMFFLGWLARESNLAFAGNVGLVSERITAAVGFWLAACLILGCSRWWSWVGAVAFALLYYGSWRGLNHLLLGFVWTIPLFVAATWTQLRYQWLLLIGFLVGISNPYWVLGALVVVIVCQRPIRARIYLVSGLAVGFVLSNLVTIIWATKLALARNYFESERFALKPLELLLPPPGGLFGNLSLAYFNQVSSPWRGEIFSPYLGIVGLAGLGLLLYSFVVSERSKMTVAQVCAVVIAGSVGGLTCLMALCGLNMFRAANRLSEFVAAIVLLYLVGRLSWMRLPRHGQIILGGLLVAAACTESLTFPHPHAGALEPQKYRDDQRLGRELDKLCPGKSFASFPPMSFPDCIWPGVEPYDNLRPWLHTSKVSFSFGQATNRLSAFDQETLSQFRSGNIELDRFSRAGYWGVVIMRKVFTDNADGLLKNLKCDVVSPDFAVIKLPVEKTSK